MAQNITAILIATYSAYSRCLSTNKHGEQCWDTENSGDRNHRHPKHNGGVDNREKEQYIYHRFVISMILDNVYSG